MEYIILTFSIIIHIYLLIGAVFYAMYALTRSPSDISLKQYFKECLKRFFLWPKVIGK